MSESKNARERRYYNRNKERINLERAAKRVSQNKGMVLEVIFDPMPEGGFSKGAELNCVKEMLEKCSFSPNTIVKNGDKTFRVAQSMGRQTLVWIEPEA